MALRLKSRNGGNPADESTEAVLETAGDIVQEAGAIAKDAILNGGAAEAVAGAGSKKRRGPGRYLLLLAFGAVLALALSEGLRSKVLDVLFGAEEEFDYTSTTTPSTAAPAGAAA
jgi:hypothetical protein